MPRPWVFVRLFWCEIELSISLSLFRPYHFEVQIELSLRSCALFVNNFARASCGPVETETRLGQPRIHNTRKIQGFAPAWIITLPNWLSHFPAILDDGCIGWLAWWCSWHDDLVDMMVWILSIPTMTTVRNSEVFYLNFLLWVCIRISLCTFYVCMHVYNI